MPGEHEQHQLVAYLASDSGSPVACIRRLHQRAHQRRIQSPDRRGSCRGSPRPARAVPVWPRGHAAAPGSAASAGRSSGRVARSVSHSERGAQRRPHLVGPLVQIDAEHRAAERAQGQARGNAGRGRRRRHPSCGRPVRRRRPCGPRTAERLFGEHRLQRTPPRQPLIVWQDQEVAAQQPAKLLEHRHLSAVRGRVGATENVVGALGRGDEDQTAALAGWTQDAAGHAAARVAHHLGAGVEGPRGSEPVPVGSGFSAPVAEFRRPPASLW